ncbi:uncharacterized protein LOC134851816 isoform X2 [Symsagittifera roscoffensis]|uniref:uncharacterized protein LOC134851816 isoform X2 n=1 Tax=Symsagittifera roscoffensis TaxID=84072 RepID=UPI00307C7F66
MSSSGAASNRQRNWSSLEFLVPGVPNNRLSQHCAEKSKRVSRPEDYGRFRQLILPIYEAYNFFTFSNTLGSCCKHQVLMYWRYGTRKGLSPEGYLKKLTDITDGGRQLNWIKANYNETICLNVISQLGFGHGFLRIEGNFKRHSDFLLLLQEGKQTHMFSPNNVTKVITFFWFKFNVICRARPWMCYT